MAIVNNPVLVELPAPRTRTVGTLLSAMRPLPAPLSTGGASQDEFWRNGVTWMEWDCRGPRVEDANFCIPADHSAVDLGDSSDCPSYFEQPAFTVWDAIRWTTLRRGEEEEIVSRLVHSVNDLVGYALAQELMTGSASGGDGVTSTGVFLGEATDPRGALAALEQHLADTLKGDLGLIHVTPRGLTYLVTNGSVRFNGTEFVSPTGHTVVADAGYNNDVMTFNASGTLVHADASETWMYATSDVFYRLDTSRVIGGLDDSSTLDLTHNLRTVYVDRQAILVFNTCATAAVLATLDDIPVS